MAYRVIILNGDQRGERRDVDKIPLLIGRDASSGLNLNDPDVAVHHAEIRTRDGALVVHSLDATNAVLINGTAMRESILQHGDVMQIGTTRFFIQALGNASAWDNLAGLGVYRRWATIGIPVVLMLAMVIGLNRCRRVPGSIPPKPAGVAPASTDEPNPDDCLVTNIPRIRIHDSVTLTSRPPEVIEAVELMVLLRTNSPDTGNDTAQMELEQATRFLKANENRKADFVSVTNQESGVADLIKAQSFLDN